MQGCLVANSVIVGIRLLHKINYTWITPIKNSIILNKDSRSQDKFQLDIQVVLARNYVNNLSEEVKKGMQQNLAAGGWCNLAPP